jgi:prolyl oligopeptidase
VLEGDPRFAQLHADATALANSRDRSAARRHLRKATITISGRTLRTCAASIAARASLTSRSGNPRWETVLDIDAIAAAENANWVFKGIDCLEGTTRCLVSLSDGGKDATTYREYDLATRSFVANGFVVPEAKSGVTWLDRNTLLVATDWGKKTATR